MSENKGISKFDCPLDLGVCYSSCYWWKDNKCIYPKSDLRTIKQLDDQKSMKQASRIAEQKRG